ncbi:MAG: septum formation initiator family protein [Desulfotalea sp.]
MKGRKKSSTTKQHQLLIKIVAGMFVVAIFFLIFSKNGMLDYYNNTQLEKQLEADQLSLILENSNLKDEVEKLDRDPASIERVARESYGLLKSNERVYDFSKPERGKKE